MGSYAIETIYLSANSHPNVYVPTDTNPPEKSSNRQQTSPFPEGTKPQLLSTNLTLPHRNHFKRLLRCYLYTHVSNSVNFIAKLKTIAAYYFLLLYTLAMCKPILPIVQDELAHIFWKAEHLATVHHHHGDHHAEKKIAEAEHKENTDKQPATTKTSEPVSVHLVIESFYGISQITIHIQQFAVNSCNVSTVLLDKYYPPPKYCTI